MILIDSNVLIDIIEPLSPYHAWSSAQFAMAVESGGFINPIVVGEISPRFSTLEDLLDVLGTFAVPIKEITVDVAWRAGRAHLAWIRNGGRRGSLLPDLLIGAHAAVEGAAVLTRDPRRFRSYFPDVTLITPENET